MTTTMRYRIEERKTNKDGSLTTWQTVARFSEQALGEVCLTQLAKVFDGSEFILYSNNGQHIARDYGIDFRTVTEAR